MPPSSPTIVVYVCVSLVLASALAAFLLRRKSKHNPNPNPNPNPKLVAYLAEKFARTEEPQPHLTSDVQFAVTDVKMLKRSAQSLPLVSPQELFATDAYPNPNPNPNPYPYFSEHTGCLIEFQGPQLLVCHDMKGGYLQDKYDNGGAFHDAFQLFHWHSIDVFVYFSHTLVTVPPRTWVGACRHNGVLALGTFITEWDQGKAFCAEMFSTEEKARETAVCLAKLCSERGFDGYLINIENALEPSWVPHATLFLSILTQEVKKERFPFSTLVLCYDSVTVEGELSWQDTVNKRNVCFFDACDGVFTNYCWKENSPMECAEFVGERVTDVYMGIDVWGRKTYGGGGYTCNVALDAVSRAGVSAALFAPGWAWEHELSTSYSEAVSPGEFSIVQAEFEQVQQKLWDPIVASCQAWPRSKFSIQTGVSNAFRTNFSQGVGYMFHRAGTLMHTVSPAYNISLQERAVVFVSPAALSCESDYSCAFDGFSCVHIHGSGSSQAVSVGLCLSLHDVFDVSEAYVIKFVVCNAAGCKVQLRLEMRENTAPSRFVLLSPKPPDAQPENSYSSACLKISETEREWVPTTQCAVGLWEQRVYVLPAGEIGSRVQSLDLICSSTNPNPNPNYDVRLGGLSIGRLDQVSPWEPVGALLTSLQTKAAVVAKESDFKHTAAVTVRAEVQLLYAIEETPLGLGLGLGQRYVRCAAYCWDMHQLIVPYPQTLIPTTSVANSGLRVAILDAETSHNIYTYMKRLEPETTENRAISDETADAYLFSKHCRLLGRTYDCQMRPELSLGLGNTNQTETAVLILVPSDAGFAQPPLSRCVFISVTADAGALGME